MWLWALIKILYAKIVDVGQGRPLNGFVCLYSHRSHIVIDPLTCDACQKRKIKRSREKKFDSLHKSKYIKLEDRPFAEGRWGCHALICFYAQSLSARERHALLPLKMKTFIMQYVAFILCHPSSYNAQFSLTLNDLTLLEAIFIAFLHRWQLTWGIFLNP